MIFTLWKGWVLLIVSYDGNTFEHCLRFQGQLFHFRPIHRNREIEHNLPNPVTILLLLRIQVNSFNKRPHKFFLLDFRSSAVHFIERQQKLVDIVAGDFLLSVI